MQRAGEDFQAAAAPTSTTLSEGVAKAFTLQADGIVNDHAKDCFKRTGA
jgi:hypothetical protein